VTDTDQGARTFEGDIRSLVRERDRAAMLDFFDLWSFDDVRATPTRFSRLFAGARCRATCRARTRRSICSNVGSTVPRHGRETNDPLPG
jgi:hypothetical protein